MKATSKTLSFQCSTRMMMNRQPPSTTVNHPTDPTNQAMRKKSLSFEYRTCSCTGTIERKKKEGGKWTRNDKPVLISQHCVMT